MSYLVLARKWRPRNFQEVIGQAQVTRTLESAVRSRRIAHAYIFSGPRGVGKTSVARILAKSLNCEGGPTAEPCGDCRSCGEIAEGNNFDVIEIDGASNNSVNDVRELRANVKYGPSEYRYKVYIIDEVHMLSTSAFNALLKTLEEPPPNTIFIFATTELHKVPLTVLSRCQRFDFHRLSLEEIEGSLGRVCEAEEIEIETRTLRLIARRADGGLRDAQSLLDQVLSFSEERVSHEEVLQALGLADPSGVLELLAFIREGEAAGAFRLARGLNSSGADLGEYLLQVAETLRNLLLLKVEPGGELCELPEEDRAELQPFVEEFGEQDLLRMLTFLGGQLEAVKKGANPLLRFELALLRLVAMERNLEVQELVRSLAGLPPGSLGGTAGNADPGADASDRRADRDDEKKKPAGNETGASSVEHDAKSVTQPAHPDKETAGSGTAAAADPLALVKERWERLRFEVAERMPFLAETFGEFLPVALQDRELVLKGLFRTPLAREQFGRLKPELEALLAELLADLPEAPRRILVEEGELVPGERFIDSRRTHLDGRSRFEELRGEHPLVEELFKRVDGKLLN